ncbi:MAG: hypothetical protein ACLU2J_01685 [Clostridia bacterium]
MKNNKNNLEVASIDKYQVVENKMAKNMFALMKKANTTYLWKKKLENIQ